VGANLLQLTVSPLDLHRGSSRAYGATLAGVPPCAAECRRVCGNLVGDAAGARTCGTSVGLGHVGARAAGGRRVRGIWIRPSRSSGTARHGEVPGPQHPAAARSARRHDGAVRPWKRRLSDDERSVLLSELLDRHPELVAEAEEITSTLLVVEDDQELADEITAKLRALRANGPVSVDTGRARSWMSSSHTSMTSPGERNAAPGERPPISRSPCCSGCTNAARTPTRTCCLSGWACPARQTILPASCTRR
jgi:hypothetical protein